MDARAHARANARGRAVVMQPDDGPSYWQPMPANGFVHLKLTPETTGCEDFLSGVQTVAPGGRVREHFHDAQVEVAVVLKGRGRFVADGVSHPLVPGTVTFVGTDVRHEIFNEGAEDMVTFFLISPPKGLAEFFARVGRARTPDEPAPAPFPRPDDVNAFEDRLGLKGTA